MELARRSGSIRHVLSHVALVEQCSPAQLRIMPANATPEVSTLTTGAMLVEIAETSRERFAEGLNVSARAC